jgi:hypothetical protein
MQTIQQLNQQVWANAKIQYSSFYLLMVLNVYFFIITATSTPKKTDALTSQQTSRFTILKFNNFKIQNSSSLRYASFLFCFNIAKSRPKTTEGFTTQQTSNFTMNQCQNSIYACNSRNMNLL